MKVAVAGGTGVVGQYVVAALSQAGHEPVVLARSRGVDITTGAGLEAALTGVGAVIDVSNVASTSKRRSIAFFDAATTHLLAAEGRAGVGHHIALSIVGIDLVDYGYYHGKRRQEEIALGSGAPVTILRATQFHEFAGQLLDRMRGPVAVMPRMRVQTIAASEVGTALAALVDAPPAGRAADLGGPEVAQLTDLAELTLAARGSTRRLLKISLPGAAGKAMREGALIPASGARGVVTFAEWLASTRE